MTREEAIEILADKVKPCLSGTDWNDAIDMAIKALEQEPTDKNFTKADIDAIVKAINAHWELIIDEIKAELHATAEMHEDGDYYLHDEWIDEYFDKYKAETEAEDGNVDCN